MRYLCITSKHIESQHDAAQHTVNTSQCARVLIWSEFRHDASAFGFAKNTSITIDFFIRVLEDLVRALMKPANEYSGGFQVMIDALDHINIETIDLERSVRFYTELLGLETGFRPTFDVEGVWLYSNKDPVIHLVLREYVNKGPTGAIHHVAFKARDCEDFKRRLKEMQVSYDLFVVPELNVTQIFVVDPNEVRLELNFYE